MRRLGDAAALTLRVPLLTQFLKFGTVGVANTLLTFIVYTVLVKGFGVWYIAASAAGFVAGATNGFLINGRWTFRGHRGGSHTALRWALVQGLGLLANLGLIYLLVDEASAGKLVGQAIAIAVIVGITFYANRRWTFRMHRGEHDRDRAARVDMLAEG